MLADARCDVTNKLTRIGGNSVGQSKRPVCVDVYCRCPFVYKYSNTTWSWGPQCRDNDPQEGDMSNGPGLLTNQIPANLLEVRYYNVTGKLFTINATLEIQLSIPMERGVIFDKLF